MQSRSLAVAAEGAGGRPAAGCFSTWFIYLAHRGAAEAAAAAAAEGEVFKVRAGQKHKCFLRNTPEPRLIQSCGQRKTRFCYTLSFLLRHAPFLVSSACLLFFFHFLLSSLRFLSSLFLLPVVPILIHPFVISFMIYSPLSSSPLRVFLIFHFLIPTHFFLCFLLPFPLFSLLSFSSIFSQSVLTCYSIGLIPMFPYPFLPFPSCPYSPSCLSPLSLLFVSFLISFPSFSFRFLSLIPHLILPFFCFLYFVLLIFPFFLSPLPLSLPFTSLSSSSSFLIPGYLSFSPLNVSYSYVSPCCLFSSPFLASLLILSSSSLSFLSDAFVSLCHNLTPFLVTPRHLSSSCFLSSSPFHPPSTPVSSLPVPVVSCPCPLSSPLPPVTASHTEEEEELNKGRFSVPRL